MFLGVMVFEALYPSLNLTDELIQRISGIFDTNAIEIRKGDGLKDSTNIMQHLKSGLIRLAG